MFRGKSVGVATNAKMLRVEEFVILRSVSSLKIELHSTTLTLSKTLSDISTTEDSGWRWAMGGGGGYLDTGCTGYNLFRD